MARLQTSCLPCFLYSAFEVLPNLCVRRTGHFRVSPGSCQQAWQGSGFGMQDSIPQREAESDTRMATLALQILGRRFYLAICQKAIMCPCKHFHHWILWQLVIVSGIYCFGSWSILKIWLASWLLVLSLGMIFGHTTGYETTFLMEWHSLGNSVFVCSLENYCACVLLKQLQNKLSLSTFNVQPISE